MRSSCTADIELDGVTIAAGELVPLALHEANVDTCVFDQPRTFDLGRADNPHLAVVHGAHYCIGAPLARIELQSVLGTLVQRVPSLRLAVGVDQLRLKSPLLTGALEELPVAW